MGSGAFAQNFHSLAPPSARVPRLGDHHFGRLDHRQGIVATFQLQRVNRVGGDDRGQRLAANPQPHLREQAVDADFLDEPRQAVARAQPGQRVVRIDGPRGRPLPAGWL